VAAASSSWRRRARPGEPGDRIQVIDPRDVARFALGLAEARSGGVYNLCAPPAGNTMRELLDACSRVVDTTNATFTRVPESFLLEQGLSDWEPVPYWVGSRRAAIRRFDATKALNAGLAVRPPVESLRDCWLWDLSRAGTSLLERTGLSPEREAHLLHLWHERALS